MTHFAKTRIAKVGRRSMAVMTSLRPVSSAGADVTIVPKAQFRRLLESDAPDPAPGLHAMAMQRRRRAAF